MSGGNRSRKLRVAAHACSAKSLMRPACRKRAGAVQPQLSCRPSDQVAVKRGHQGQIDQKLQPGDDPVDQLSRQREHRCSCIMPKVSKLTVWPNTSKMACCTTLRPARSRSAAEGSGWTRDALRPSSRRWSSARPRPRRAAQGRSAWPASLMPKTRPMPSSSATTPRLGDSHGDADHPRLRRRQQGSPPA